MPDSKPAPEPGPGGCDRSARRLSRLCRAIAIALAPVVVAVLLLDWPQAMLAALAADGIGLDVSIVSTWRLITTFALAVVPVSLMAIALWRASQCLQVFGRCEYFSAEAVRHLRGFSAFVLLAAIAGIIVPTLAIVLLTIGRGPGKGQLTVSLGTDDLFLILFAAVSWQIARVLGRAVALAEDHAQIV
jgi:hypothetical protein